MSLNKTFVAGSTVIAAADLNGLQAAWDTYTPVAGNFTVGNGTLTGRYYRQGKTVALRVNFTAGSTTTWLGNNAQVSLPLTAATAEQDLFVKLATSGSVITSGLGNIVSGGTTCTIYVPVSSTTVSMGGMGTATLYPGTTGNFVIEGVYEAA